jgi:hypothetical protein
LFGFILKSLAGKWEGIKAKIILIRKNKIGDIWFELAIEKGDILIYFC